MASAQRLRLCAAYVIVLSSYVYPVSKGLEMNSALQTSQSTNEYDGRLKWSRRELLQISNVRLIPSEIPSIQSSSSRSVKQIGMHSIVHLSFSMLDFLWIIALNTSTKR